MSLSQAGSSHSSSWRIFGLARDMFYIQLLYRPHFEICFLPLCCCSWAVKWKFLKRLNFRLSMQLFGVVFMVKNFLVRNCDCNTQRDLIDSLYKIGLKFEILIPIWNPIFAKKNLTAWFQLEIYPSSAWSLLNLVWLSSRNFSSNLSLVSIHSWRTSVVSNKVQFTHCVLYI